MKREIEIFILLSHLPYKMLFKELGSSFMKQVVSMVIDDLQLPIRNTIEYNSRELYKTIKDHPIITDITYKVFESLSKVKNWDTEYVLEELVVDINYILIRLKE